VRRLFLSKPPARGSNFFAAQICCKQQRHVNGISSNRDRIRFSANAPQVAAQTHVRWSKILFVWYLGMYRHF
jgi:hypothetical protein